MTSGKPAPNSHTTPFPAGLGGLVRRMCGVVATCAVLAGTAQAGQPPRTRTPSAGGQTVAVLPFVNTSGVERDRWIGRGIAETLASDLQSIAGVMVADRGALSRGADEGAAPQAVRELGAAWLIAGSYQRVGDDLRVIARLFDVGTGVVVHTVMVDGSLEELFGLQDRVVAELSDAIRTRQQPPSLAARRKSASVSPAATPSAAASTIYHGPTYSHGVQPCSSKIR